MPVERYGAGALFRKTLARERGTASRLWERSCPRFVELIQADPLGRIALSTPIEALTSLARLVAEVKMTHLALSDQGEREDSPPAIK